MEQKDFKVRLNLDQRIKKQQKIMERNLIPLILQPIQNSKLPRLSKEAMGLPPLKCISDIKQILRKELELDQNQALLIFCEKQILNDNAQFVDLYMSHKDKQDQLLYLYYSMLQAFG